MQYDVYLIVLKVPIFYAIEFQEQAERERELNIPVLPFMQGLDDPTKRYKAQVGFIDFVMSPLWTGVEQLFPQMKVSHSLLKKYRFAGMKCMSSKPVFCSTDLFGKYGTK